MRMRITDERCRQVNDQGVTIEPGSVLMSQGLSGTAWQLRHQDHLWHRAGGGRPLTTDEILRLPNVWLVYQAPRRDR